MSLFPFVGLEELDIFVFGKLSVEDLACVAKDDGAAFACHDPAKNLDVAHVLVEVAVMRDAVAEVGADGLVDLAGALVTCSHQFLHALEAQRESVGSDVGHLDPRRRDKPRNRLL